MGSYNVCPGCRGKKAAAAKLCRACLNPAPKNVCPRCKGRKDQKGMICRSCRMETGGGPIADTGYRCQRCGGPRSKAAATGLCSGCARLANAKKAAETRQKQRETPTAPVVSGLVDCGMGAWAVVVPGRPDLTAGAFLSYESAVRYAAKVGLPVPPPGQASGQGVGA